MGRLPVSIWLFLNTVLPGLVVFGLSSVAAARLVRRVKTARMSARPVPRQGGGRKCATFSWPLGAVRL